MGAVDYIAKNLSDTHSNIADVRNELLAKVKAVANKPGLSERSSFEKKRQSENALKNLGGSPPGSYSGRYLDYKGSDEVDLVALGASTGGPKALQEILSQLPGNFPAPIIISQHMPGVFTKPFAERINKLCEIEIKEAEENDIIRPGVALLAPGGYQMRVKKRNSECRVEISNEPKEIIYKPSVDITMISASQSFDNRCVGVILTGMGSDGLEGMRAIKSQGGMTIAQNKKSCVVYGMPKMVIEAGVADKIIPLDNIADELLRQVHYSLLSA
jgi:two-component system chemotaxis response regulator CheB